MSSAGAATVYCQRSTPLPHVTWVEAVPRPYAADEGRHPRLYFGGASPAAEQVAASEADVQLFWGEPLDGIEERIARLRPLSEQQDRSAPLEFGD